MSGVELGSGGQTGEGAANKMTRREVIIVGILGVTTLGLGGKVLADSGMFDAPLPYEPPTPTSWRDTDRRMEALERFTDSGLLEYMPVSLELEKGRSIYATPETTTTDGPETYWARLKKSEVIDNPVVIRSEEYGNWALVDGPYGAAYVPLSSGATSSDDRALGEQALQGENWAELEGNDTIKFRLTGFTFDGLFGATSKRDFVDTAKRSEIIHLSHRQD